MMLLHVVTDDRERIGRRYIQLGAKFGVGRSGGIEKAILISLTSDEIRARPHIWLNLSAQRPRQHSPALA
jgi:hypothetical protein